MLADNFVQQFQALVSALQKNTPVLLMLLSGLWALQLVNWLFRYRLNILGIYPRSPQGLVGIFFSPFLHGDFNHLFFNSIPLFILASFVLLAGWKVFICVSLIIIVLSGILVWLFARRGIHIGASGLIMGYWSYLLMQAYEQGSVLAIVLGGICIYYFAGFIFNLLPSRGGTSWEAHLFGFVGGLAAVFALPVFLPLLNSF